ncbi:MAG: hypothetical protein K2I60_00415 [Oscillospiraceae bacterium]|nr:hypothetical protein [Oscillospiraceae bacterium]
MNDMNLQKFLSLIKRRLAWLFLGLMVGFFIMMFVSLIIPKQYKSSVQIYVTTYSFEQNSNTTLVQSSEIIAAEKLANTCSIILKNEDILQLVSNKLTEHTTAKQIKESLNIKVVSGTQILEITSTTNNVKLSVDICNTLAKVASLQLQNIINGIYVKEVGNATIPYNASSPNILNNSLIGAFLGLFITIVIVLLIELSDNTIKTADTFKKHCKIPVLGEIPSFKQ